MLMNHKIDNILSGKNIVKVFNAQEIRRRSRWKEQVEADTRKMKMVNCRKTMEDIKVGEEWWTSQGRTQIYDYDPPW